MLKKIFANWKMNPATVAYAEKIVASLAVDYKNEVIILPPYVYLIQIAELLKSLKLSLGAQDCAHFNGCGPYTGSVSATMLREIGCRYVVVGHSERRNHYLESDDVLSKKLQIILENGLTPVLCVGEQHDIRQSKQTIPYISEQLNVVLMMQNIDYSNVIIAYEPIWAIGTGLIPELQEIAEVVTFIKSTYGVNVIYGGSVNRQNVIELSKITQLDGLLVGNASLNPKDFIDIANAF